MTGGHPTPADGCSSDESTPSQCGVCDEPASFVVVVEYVDSTDRYGACVEHAMDLDGMVGGVTVTPIERPSIPGGTDHA